MSLHQSFLAADRRTLSVRARADLVTTPMTFRGQEGFVVKDPLTAEVYQLSREEGFLLDALRRPISLARLKELFAETFPPHRLSLTQLQQFVGQLFQYGLLVSHQPGAAERLAEQGNQQRIRQRWTRLLHLLAIRVAGCDAHGPIDRLYAILRPLFGWHMLLVAVATAGYAVVLLLAHAPEAIRRLPNLAELVGPGRWPIWIAAIASVKLLHELGHALVCRHYGGRVREIGLLLLGFVPTLYCDVSDAWRLPSKWQRMAISAAGMLVELFVAAAAAIVWWHTTPGLIHSLSLSIVITASLGTVLINANPLLRYDGYFLLLDWLEVPNLAERSRGVLRQTLQNWLLGESDNNDATASRQNRGAMVLYAALSKAYVAFVVIAIFATLLAVARPLRLEGGVYLLMLLTAIGMLMPSLAGVVRWANNPVARRRFRPLRLAVALGVLAAGTVGVLVFPITRHVEAPATVVAADATPIFTTVAGRLEWAAEPMADVKEGEVIARLSDPPLAAQVERVRGETALNRLRYEQLRRLRVTQTGLAGQASVAAAELADAEQRLAQFEQQAELLLLRAPRAGRLLPPPRRELPDPDASTLPDWSGRALDRDNRGAWLEAGVPVAAVAGTQRMHVWAAVDPADVAAVQPGQPVRLSVAGWPGEVFSGRVDHVARQATLSDGPAFDGQRVSYHVVEIEVAATDTSLLSGVAGQVKIETHATTIGGKLLRILRRQLRRF